MYFEFDTLEEAEEYVANANGTDVKTVKIETEKYGRLLEEYADNLRKDERFKNLIKVHKMDTKAFQDNRNKIIIDLLDELSFILESFLFEMPDHAVRDLKNLIEKIKETKIHNKDKLVERLELSYEYSLARNNYDAKLCAGSANRMLWHLYWRYNSRKLYKA